MKPGKVRIIAGKWRGRRIQVAELANLRPTPDRVRETLFNWLAPHLHGARCLDLFAGTGALGFEAISRGAGDVLMVDAARESVQLISQQLHEFKAEVGRAYQAELPQGLRAGEKPFDIVFIDPPYESGLLLPTCRFLEENHFLADNALLYLEARDAIEDNDLPQNWQLIKRKKAGQVHYHLAKRQANDLKKESE